VRPSLGLPCFSATKVVISRADVSFSFVILPNKVEMLPRADRHRNPNASCPSCNSRKSSQFAQMIWKVKALGFGHSSRQGAKHVLSNLEGAPSDGLRTVIPSECEGSKKDFSLRSK